MLTNFIKRDQWGLLSFTNYAYPQNFAERLQIRTLESSLCNSRVLLACLRTEVWEVVMVEWLNTFGF